MNIEHRIDGLVLSEALIMKAYRALTPKYLEYSTQHGPDEARANFMNGGRMSIRCEKDKLVGYDMRGVHFERVGDELAVVANLA